MSSDGSRRSRTGWRRRNASARRRGRGRRGGRRRLLKPLPISRFAALIVDNGSGLSTAVTLYSLRLSAGLSCSVSWRYGPERQYSSCDSSSILAVAYAKLVLLVSSRFVPLRCRQAQDAPHHGWYAPEGQLCSGLVLLVTTLLALCSRLLSSDPRCSASWPV